MFFLTSACSGFWATTFDGRTSANVFTCRGEVGGSSFSLPPTVIVRSCVITLSLLVVVSSERIFLASMEAPRRGAGLGFGFSGSTFCWSVCISCETTCDSPGVMLYCSSSSWGTSDWVLGTFKNWLPLSGRSPSRWRSLADLTFRTNLRGVGWGGLGSSRSLSSDLDALCISWSFCLGLGVGFGPLLSESETALWCDSGRLNGFLGSGDGEVSPESVTTRGLVWGVVKVSCSTAAAPLSSTDLCLGESKLGPALLL